MAKNIIEFDNLDMEVIKKIAQKNSRPYKLRQDLINLQNEIVVKCINLLDEESFNQITNLKL